ncbi:ROK family protein [Streptomyces sp. NBC_00878]|uniref:ROK family protein n=1 Tax=Streptomyces sp. NBC_00878 TaxID=2975854 RepID=UPI0022584D9B|nr:ROK family protein [Streptomyces sp. NBC_00878]MCX4906573.1 ROK family protein [Streptomyces sp. NBC_00878]
MLDSAASRGRVLDSTVIDSTVIGIDFGGTKTAVALADARGNLLRQLRIPTRAEQGPDQILARACAAALELAGQARSHHGAPVGAYAAVAPGVIRPDRILLSPNLPGWEDLALAERLQRELGVDVVPVTNDVRAGALAEARSGALRDADPGIYISLGTGIAAALTIGGKVLNGAHQAAGEIAYLEPGPGVHEGGVHDGGEYDGGEYGAGRAPLPSGRELMGAGASAGERGCAHGSITESLASTEPVARAEPVDLRAPLEELVGGKGLGARASALLGREVSATDLFGRDDPASQRLARQALGALAVAVANIAVLVDPARIAVGGGMMAAAEHILPALSAHLSRTVPFPPDVVPAHFLEDASLHGAVALAVDHLAVEHLAPGT